MGSQVVSNRQQQEGEVPAAAWMNKPRQDCTGVAAVDQTLHKQLKQVCVPNATRSFMTSNRCFSCQRDTLQLSLESDMTRTKHKAHMRCAMRHCQCLKSTHELNWTANSTWRQPCDMHGRVSALNNSCCRCIIEPGSSSDQHMLQCFCTSCSLNSTAAFNVL